jgi:hypothetical protein
MATKQRNKRQHRLGPFVPVLKATMATSAWRAMSCGARMLYVELRGRLSNDYSNNGRVFLSDRDGAEALGVMPGTVVRYYAEIEHYGFLRKTSGGFLGSDGRGIAAYYRFTEFPHGTHPPTRDFEKWDGELFIYRPKKRNPVSKINTPRVENRHIRNGSNRASVCVENRHIGKPPRCVENRHISRRTTPQPEPYLNQGSSTARAPVQAGDVGSSPAPVTRDASRHSREAIMALVAGVVAEQLNALEARRFAHIEIKSCNEP